MSKEYPCIYYDNEKCKKFSDDEVTSYCVMGPCSHETPSHGDCIRAKSDEALAEVILCPYDSDSDICKSNDNCDKCCFDWLRQPAEGEQRGETDCF